MKSSLIPELPLLVYPSLAATLGLDEAVMLATLSDLVAQQPGAENNNFTWFQLDINTISERLPFWDRRDLHRVSTSLREKGVILIASAPLLQEDQFKFAFNEKASQQASANQPHSSPNASAQNTVPLNSASHNSAAHNMAARSPAPPAQPQAVGKNFISNSWRPDGTVMQQLAQLSVPEAFAMEQLPEFITYWRERNEPHHSWGQKFISHVLKRWRTFEAQQARQNKAHPIPSHWEPSPQIVESLEGKHIPRNFILDQVQEFISFWQATAEKHVSWDSKFSQRILRLWAESETKRNVANKDYPIFSSWRPSEDAMELMTRKSEIPLSFIEDTIPEFIIYWKDRGTSSSTWNSMFINHVRLQWHRYQHSLDSGVEAKAISDNWEPSKDVYDILAMANIDPHFARGLIAEFILYWKDRNELHRSWNTRFLQHVKRMWAARHQMNAAGTNESNVRSTRDISLEEELNDTSWAN